MMLFTQNINLLLSDPPPPHPPPQKDSYKGRSHMRPRMDFHLVLHGEYL